MREKGEIPWMQVKAMPLTGDKRQGKEHSSQEGDIKIRPKGAASVQMREEDGV